MNAYLVRLKSDQTSPRELVGLFFAEELDDLWPMIDECTDVQSCEVKLLPAGGIYWDCAFDYVVPLVESENAPDLPGGANFSEGWADAFCSEGRWELIPSAGLDHANDIS